MSSSYSSAYNTTADAYSAIAAIGGIGVILFSILIGLIIGLAVVVVISIPIYQMAKKAGHPKPWLAFIPYGRQYVISTLPHRTYKLFFDCFRTDKRSKAFWWYFGIAFGVVAVSLVLAFLCIIPIIGFFFSLLSYGVSILSSIAMVLIMWRMNYDFVMTYDTKETALLISIISCFIPIVFVVYTFIVMNREPSYGFDGYFDTSDWEYEK